MNEQSEFLIELGTWHVSYFTAYVLGIYMNNEVDSTNDCSIEFKYSV